MTDGHEQLIRKHVIDMRLWNIRVPSDMEQLPSMYWLLKLHKCPYFSRFIAASNKCTTKPLSSLLTSCLTTVLIHYKGYCGGIFTNTGIRVINNLQSVILSMQALNSTSKPRSTNTYDFSTLYTSIPHNSLKFIMKELIEEALQEALEEHSIYLLIIRGRVIGGVEREVK